MLIALVIFAGGCSKDEFSERDAIAAQKELLNLKYQHELDLEALKQKGANAMQELINTAALEQLKFNDSLSRASAIAAAKQDYSVAVVDVVTNAPILDADVIVSSQGKVFATKTNAQGIAMFNALYLFPTSTFLISKSGYAATHVLQKDITLGTAKLWNTSDLSNEISGTLYIETDLTNATPEKIGANVLVTASATVPNGFNSNYTISFPTFSTADGTYAIKVPVSPGAYVLSFGEVTADQKLYINGFANAEEMTPNQLPFLTTVKTYFSVNNFTAIVPEIRTPMFLRFPKDKAGNIISVPINSYNGSNQVLLSAQNGSFQIERLNLYSSFLTGGNYINFSSFTFDSDTEINVELIDITGKIIQTAPLLTASSNSQGKLVYTEHEGGYGYVHLKRDGSGTILPNAKGVILKAVPYDTYSNLYSLSFNENLNTTSNSWLHTDHVLLNKGEKKVVNFYYGSGQSRDKQVY